ncbi:hypothetical protein HR060_04040 [Catenovulum sp. SM1970]|uniref:hypothetical protein n=1 Tax=Marinifaba aquimaris TaxID=2741323 RepID=UPI001574218B|nr:hypothetical protein [Marinifaba aquimaris]NTS76030.1 hypothetical protein [Marinifaba aquimaris]
MLTSLKPLLFALVLVYLALCNQAKASELQIDLLVDFPLDTIVDKNTLPLRNLRYLEAQSQDQLNIRLVSANMARQWVLLEKQENACLLNKIKTPERSQKAIFTQKPIGHETPLRLITIYPIEQDTINLEHLYSWQPDFIVGVVNGRSYSPIIDKFVSNNSKVVLTRSGDMSSRKLIDMLAIARVDAINEYTKQATLFAPKGTKLFAFI